MESTLDEREECFSSQGSFKGYLYEATTWIEFIFSVTTQKFTLWPQAGS